MRFLTGEAERRATTAIEALQMAGPVNSAMIRTSLSWLLTESEPYGRVPRVVEFRERLRATIGG